MFYFFSKVITAFLRPLFWLMILLLWNLFTKNSRLKKRLTLVLLSLMFLCSNKIVVNELAILWEDNDQPVKFKTKTALVLGGFSNWDDKRKTLVFSSAAERLFKAIELYQKHLIDTIFISGGNASAIGKTYPEAYFARKYLVEMGIDSSKIFEESQSKSTIENAEEIKKILNHNHLQHREFLLITSAFHMKRAKACFAKNKLKVVGMPVQFIGNPSREYLISDFFFPSSQALMHFDLIVKEWFGWLGYKLARKI